MGLELKTLHEQLRACRLCPEMCGKPVTGRGERVEIMLIGQAPGPHEEKLGKPFAYTAGKTLFQWLGQVSGFNEEELRARIYFAAVARCFPGKHKSGKGDREPSPVEIANCRQYLAREVEILKPKLILALGKLAISEVLGAAIFKKSDPLATVIGKKFFLHYQGVPVHVIPLPHPSGVSRWHRTSPGKELLSEALELVGKYLK